MTIIVTSTTDQISTAREIAKSLGIDYLPYDVAQKAPATLILVVTPEYLGLSRPGDKKPYFINFSAKSIDFRRQNASLRKELIGKAMGSKPEDQPIIVDGTAGVGRDSFILASLGFQVFAVERSPILCLLLKDALKRAALIVPLQKTIERIHLIEANTTHWLKKQNRVDIVYLDPMFPARKKKAAVKKEMTMLQDLIGSDEDSETLLKTALACATYRVVVKRPRLAGYLAKHPPNFSFEGQRCRFDIYLV